jgi:hypothetical protein
LRLSSFRRAVLSVLGALAVTGVLGFALARRGGQFTTALHSAPIALLLLTVLLQILALLARGEAGTSAFVPLGEPLPAGCCSALPASATSRA